MLGASNQEEKMKGLITVGKLAKLGGITVKTLKHYEKLGLMKPVYIDPLTNYRYYSMDQVKNIYEILSLKDLGLSLGDIQSTWERNILKDKLLEVRNNTEKKIAELEELLSFANSRLDTFELETKEDFKIEYLHMKERRFYIYLFRPIDKMDSSELYLRALEMERELPAKKKPFRGAVLDKVFFTKGKYRCLGLFQELKDYSDVSQEKILILPAGIYLSLWYRGNPNKKNDEIMKQAMEYIQQNSLQLEGRIIGFAHRGAHTGDDIEDYESEIQLLLK